MGAADERTPAPDAGQSGEWNPREGTLGGAVKRANVNLATRSLPRLPEKLTRSAFEGRSRARSKGSLVPIGRAGSRAA
jgi:hypothetical protein